MLAQSVIAHAESLLPGSATPPGTLDPRWQAIIGIGDLIDSYPEDVWAFVARWGEHSQEDLRDAIATCLLEHLLEHHFALVFPRVRDLAMENRLFADTLLRCWKLGQALSPGNSEGFDRLRARCAARSLE